MTYWFTLLFLAYAIALQVALSRRGVTLAPIPTARPPGPESTVSKVLIVGATGGTGRALVTQALERGYQVTALVRNPARLSMTHPHLRVVQGDVLDASSVSNAVRGQDAVVCALGHKRFFGPSRILSEGTRHLIQAMDTHGVSRLVCQTSIGIGSSTGRLGLYYTFFTIPVILPFYYWDKTRQEELIEASRTAWVIVRPVALSSAAGRGRCRHGSRVGSFILTQRVPRVDVAMFMLDRLTDNQYLRTAVGVSSDASRATTAA